DGKMATTLVYCYFGVAVTSNHLQHVQPNAEQTEHGDDEHLDKPQARPKVLRCVFEFHKAQFRCHKRHKKHKKSAKAFLCVCAFLWLISFVKVRSSAGLRGGVWRIVFVVRCAQPPEHPARKARACPPPSSRLICKTSSALTVRRAGNPTPGARKRRWRNPAPRRPR